MRAHLERYALFRVAESVVRGFTKDRVTNAAAAMTYYGIFSLFPLLLLFMALAGFALQSNAEARERILAVVVGLLPQGQDQLQQVIAGVIDTKGTAAGVGLLILLWSALGWFQVIDHNVNLIWGVDKPRSFVKGKLFALAMVAAIGGVALLSWTATGAIGILGAYTDVIPAGPQVWQALVSVLSVLTIAGAFLVLYRFTPRRQVELADAWPAALATALLWELTRRVVAFYLGQTNMISGYGPIGAAMALLFWVYVSSIIILLGAEVAYAVAKDRRHLRPDQEMQVAAAPGEQPTPKFAPQVGSGIEQRDGREPIVGVEFVDGGERRSRRADPAVAATSQRSWTARPVSNQRRPVRRPGGSASPSGLESDAKHALWAGLTAASMATAGLLARRASAGIWKAVLHQQPPTAKV
jgi:membrane protein